MRKSVTLCSLDSYIPEKRKIFSSDETRKGIAPGEYVIRNILNYSKALSVIKSEHTGCIHMVMN